MKEVFDKIIGFIHSEIARTTSYAEHDTQINIKFFVEQLRDEYNNGWISCSEDKPKKNGFYECWYMTSAVGENKYYEPITLYWEDNIWLYRPNKFTMPTQGNVIAWKPIVPYQPKGE